ncbi:hypothetical protein [Tissierella sp. Yu-01]|uniref:hypothetical protein n=1 Tax=Tissierella sp. Yu-01 TaxID=3035694 RepID=UPI00240DB9DC|nr:hypothetical protein [Tissierella sp. Yu-01]WFA09520.1 hypothetical protein P3962_02915 [Tissierella sp. Yu-01]
MMKSKKKLRDYNFECALKICSGGAREDHVDGEHAVDRLAAYKMIDQNLPFTEYMNQVTDLFYTLRKLEIPPTRIFIFDDGMVEVNWEANGYQVLSSRHQYAALVIEFAKFLESLDIDLKIQTGMYYDDPHVIRDLAKVNCSPSFNRECFGSRYPLEIICNWFISFQQDDYYKCNNTFKNNNYMDSNIETIDPFTEQTEILEY